MERNWDTIREIMLAVEALSPDQTLKLSDFGDARAHEISHHVRLLDEAGLVRCSISDRLGSGPRSFTLRSLTWHGHELLDAIRNDTIWTRTKTTLQRGGGAMTLELVKSVAAQLIKSALT